MPWRTRSARRDPPSVAAWNVGFWAARSRARTSAMGGQRYDRSDRFEAGHGQERTISRGGFRVPI
jgi:hypothetical protein